MSQDNNNNAPKKSNLANSAAARGYVQTQQSLYGLVNELVATIKGIRKEQKQQHEKIEELTKSVNEQKEELELLRCYQKQSGGGVPVRLSSTASSTDGSYQTDLAQLRRELVGMIGESLALHEEEHHEEDTVPVQNTVHEPRKGESTNPTAATANPSDYLQKEWDDFRSRILPRTLIRTFHCNGATLLRGRPHCTSYIDYEMQMATVCQNKGLKDVAYSWCFQAQGAHWSVGMATISAVSKWDPSTDDNKDNKLLGDAKGEWAFRSDGTLWSHSKQRQALDVPSQANDVCVGIELTLEFHFNTRILLKGSINHQRPAVWFDIPWKNFKKPTSFVPAVTAQNESIVRFRGWDL